MGFPGASAGKESACNAEDLGKDTWVGKIPWRKQSLPTIQYSSLENSMDCIVTPWGLKELDPTQGLSLSTLKDNQ